MAGVASAAAQPAPAAVQPVSLDDVKANWPRLDDNQRVAAIEQLIRHGAFDEAEALIGAWRPAHDEAKLHAKFLLGVLRKSQGRVDEGIAILRDLLAANPKLMRVRLELAHALFVKQEDESARHHFELVLGSAANPALEQTVHRFIDAMEKRRAWHSSAYITLAPSTNLNQGANVKSVNLNGFDFTIDEKNRKQSGVGLMTGVLGGYRWALSDRLDLVVGGGVHLREFRADTFDDRIMSVEAGPRYRFASGDIAAYATLARRWYGGDAYSWARGGRLHGMLRLSPQMLVNAGTACAVKEHDRHTYQDGWNCAVTLSLDRAVDAAGFVCVLGGVERERTERRHLDYDAWNSGIGSYRDLPYGISVYGQLLYTRRDYDGIYPTATEARQDDRLDATLHITKRNWQIFGFAPMLQYTYTWNHSNIAFHTFDAHSVSTTLTKKF